MAGSGIISIKVWIVLFPRRKYLKTFKIRYLGHQLENKIEFQKKNYLISLIENLVIVMFCLCGFVNKILYEWPDINDSDPL